MESLKLEDLGVTFIDFSKAKDNAEEFTENEGQNMLFCPSKKQLKSYENWEGCDGSFFFPYGRKDKIGKISDFVTAASLAKKMDEKALDAPKSVKEAISKKATKAVKEESKGDVVDDWQNNDDAFITVEEKSGRINRDKKPQWNKNQQNNWNQKNEKTGGGWEPEQ